MIIGYPPANRAISVTDKPQRVQGATMVIKFNSGKVSKGETGVKVVGDVELRGDQLNMDKMKTGHDIAVPAPTTTGRPGRAQSRDPDSPFHAFLRKASDHPVMLVIVIVVSVLSLIDYIETPFAPPTIDRTGTDPESPFVFPFAVKNNSR